MARDSRAHGFRQAHRQTVEAARERSSVKTAESSDLTPVRMADHPTPPTTEGTAANCGGIGIAANSAAPANSNPPRNAGLPTFEAHVEWVIHAGTTPMALPQKVKLTVQVEAASLATATVRDLKRAIRDAVIASHSLKLPMKRQTLILKGSQLLDNAALLAPLRIVGPGAQDTPVFLVCRTPERAAAAAGTGTAAPAGDSAAAASVASAPAAAAAAAPPAAPPAAPVVVLVELSQLLGPPPAVAATGQPWVVEATYAHGVTTFGMFIASLIKAHGRTNASRTDLCVVA